MARSLQTAAISWWRPMTLTTCLSYRSQAHTVRSQLDREKFSFGGSVASKAISDGMEATTLWPGSPLQSTRRGSSLNDSLTAALVTRRSLKGIRIVSRFPHGRRMQCVCVRTTLAECLNRQSWCRFSQFRASERSARGRREWVAGDPDKFLLDI